MGFFSNDCKGCGNSVRHIGACRTESAWMAQAVALSKGGDRVSGEYDGYGRIGRYDDDNGLQGMAVWHRACWELAGKPEFDGASRSANDQGHFVGEYDPAQPKNVAEMAALKAEADERVRIEREERAKRFAAYEAKKLNGGAA